MEVPNAQDGKLKSLLDSMDEDEVLLMATAFHIDENPGAQTIRDQIKQRLDSIDGGGTLHHGPGLRTLRGAERAVFAFMDDNTLRKLATSADCSSGSLLTAHGAWCALHERTGAECDLDKAIQAVERLSSKPATGEGLRVLQVKCSSWAAVLFHQESKRRPLLAQTGARAMESQVYLDRAKHLMQMAIQSTPDDGGDILGRPIRRLTRFVMVVEVTTHLAQLLRLICLEKGVVISMKGSNITYLPPSGDIRLDRIRAFIQLGVHGMPGGEKYANFMLACADKMYHLTGPGSPWIPQLRASIMIRLEGLIVVAEETGVVDENTPAFNRELIAGLDESNVLRFLAQSSLRNFMRRQLPTDTKITEAIKAAQDVVSATSVPLFVELKPYALLSLGQMIDYLCTILHELEREDRIDYGIKCLEEALQNLELPGFRRWCLRSLGSLHLAKYKVTGNISDVRASVAKLETALGSASDRGVEADRERAKCLHDLSESLGYMSAECWRGALTWEESLEIMQRRVALGKKGMALLPADDPERLLHAATLAHAYGNVLLYTGDRNALDKGIEICDSLSHLVEGASSQAKSRHWMTHSTLLMLRYHHTGLAQDLPIAAIAAWKAFRAIPRDDILYPTALERLCETLVYGPQATADGRYAPCRQDMDELLEAAEELVNRVPAKTLKKSHYLNILVQALLVRTDFLPLDEQKDQLDRALHLVEEATELAAQDGLYTLKNLDSLQRLHMKMAVVPGSSPAAHMGHALSAMQAIYRQGSGTPSEARILDVIGNLNWANSVIPRSKAHPGADIDIHPDVAHLDAAIDAWERSSRCSNPSKPAVRVETALKAAKLLVGYKHDYPRADTLLRASISQLHLVNQRSLHQTDHQRGVRKLVALGTLAAATALQLGADAGEALALLEEGRGHILGLLFDARLDVSALRAHSEHAAAAADEYERLREELDMSFLGVGSTSAEFPELFGNGGAATAPTSSFFEPTRREKLADELNASIKRIQSIEGFQGFMRAPLVSELKQAAAKGAIVVLNVCAFRCDAFFVRHNYDVATEPLPGLELADIMRWSNAIKTKSITEAQMFELLAWIWDLIAVPMLRRLDETGWERSAEDKPESMPRIWWIPTGPLDSLPIHAAGRYEQGDPAFNTLLARVLSSYTPSIKALLFAQRNRLCVSPRYADRKGKQVASREDQVQESPPPPKALVICMENTDGQSTLGAAKREATEVRDLLLSTTIAASTTTTTAAPKITVPEILFEPNKAEVLDVLGDASLLHFAGHGRSNPAHPLQSALLLRDWEEAPLTVTDLMDRFRRRQHPRFLAYLSACSTGSNRDPDLADESLHLMSACQLVGFQHVVGSLWEVSDGHCVDIARGVYASLARGGLASPDDGVVARGLRDAVAAGPGRDGHPIAAAEAAGEHARPWRCTDPRLWAAYIHMGV
ncbi:hypothetical protein GGTG_09390 [Gaeumannomyces tritici R3-111a-1]|uniref:CHAT domain-containing protein n=1 Tax=Gaeumannomyces tritici (strain R3-111a-1) TaxID=644352 RepID=J3P794_GAET3|nr:hypothetical protein GGTG_09390 [Gaeumannomyces tritici R3-111a-1]EJT72525.1 hypothetical protein GGTG_09390 [Gaeumannomyces tritici R3-111a-1]